MKTRLSAALLSVMVALAACESDNDGGGGGLAFDGGVALDGGPGEAGTNEAGTDDAGVGDAGDADADAEASDFSVGGTVSGLAGGAVTLQNNLADDLTVNADGAFTFATRVASGATYAVSVKTPPAGKVCAVTDRAGVITDASVSNIAVVCGLNLGVYDDLGEDTFQIKENLLGFRMVIPEDAMLVGFGLIGREAGSAFKMALYRDAGGVPGALVASTPSTALAGGRQEITVAPTPVTAGAYWLMGIFETGALVAYGAGGPEVHYIQLPYTSPLPTTFPTPTTYTGQSFSYYVKVQ